jgi:hypothetical protein
MFDLGQTLVDASGQPFPHVRTALAAIAGFKTADGRPLRSCLVSDFTMPAPPVKRGAVQDLFADYLALLDGTGLRPDFEPVARRVTLSTQAGARKPDAAVFEKALSRLHVKAALDECLLVTENARHIAAARKALGMQGLQFRSPASARFDFDDWSQAPALIAQRVGRPANVSLAVQSHLAAQGVEADAPAVDAGDGPWTVSGRSWQPVDLPGLGLVHVSVPVRGQVRRAASGALTASLDTPSAEDVAEAREFARSLAVRRQICTDGRDAPHAASHALETDSEGRRRLVRRRFVSLAA